MSSDSNKQQAIDLARTCHSFLLTGFAGTGKTTILREIITMKKKEGKEVVVCASTGLSSLVLSEGGSCESWTVHSLFGLMDGRYSTAELLQAFSGEDDYYMERREILQQAQCVVIDEVSMLSMATLQQVNRVMQYCKRCDKVFGGAQRIFCGDFLQLPPVKNHLSGDVGQPAILDGGFELFVPHKVTLTQIQRTADASLIRCVQQLSTGRVSDETFAFLEQRTAPLDVAEGDKLVLYGLRQNVEIHNEECLSRQPGQVVTYKSTDKPDGVKRWETRSIIAEKTLRLKLGVPVMLIKNISRTLVNGMRGWVERLHETSVAVYFSSIQQTHTITPVEFTRCGPCGSVVCSRRQIPLVLCYATTVHKAQGLSADYVEVHVEDMHFPSLLPVAISRVRTAAGLRVVGFSQKSIIPPDEAVVTAITRHGAGTPYLADGSCCLVDDPTVGEMECSQPSTVGEVEASDPMDVDAAVNCPPLAVGPAEPTGMSDPSLTPLLQRQLVAQPVTRQHERNNADIMALLENPATAKMYEELQAKLVAMTATATAKSQPGDKKNWQPFTNLMEQVHVYMTVELRQLLLRCQIDVKYLRYLSHMCTDILTELMDSAVRQRVEESPQETGAVSSSAANNSKVRYMGGRTFYKMRNAMAKSMRTAARDVTSTEYARHKTVVLSIQQLTTSLYDARTGRYPQSLADIERRSQGGGLTCITDGAFELFLAIERKREAVQTVARALVVGPTVLQEAYTTLCADTGLRAKLDELLSARLTEDSEAMEVLFKLLLKKFLPAANNAYRQRLQSALQKTKTVAHRPSIAARSEGSAAKKARRTATKVMAGATAASVDSQCRAKSCSVRKTATSGRVRWIACDTCGDWWHVQCTQLDCGLSGKQLTAMEWRCAHCKNASA